MKSLKDKISAVCLALILLLFFVGVSSIVIVAMIQSSIGNIMTANYRSVQLAQNMLTTLSAQNQAAVAYAADGSEAAAQRFFQQEELFGSNMAEEEHNISQNGEQALVDRVNASYAKYQSAYAALRSVRDARGSAAALAYYEASVSPLYTSLEEDIRSISQLNQSGLQKSETSTARQTSFSMLLLFLLTASVGLGGFFLSRHFAARFLQPLQQLTGGIGKMRAGRWEFDPKIQTGDEIGRLAREIQSMAERLALFEKSTKGELVKEKTQSVAIVRSISEPLLVLDHALRIVLTNSAGEELFRIGESAAGHHFMECIHEEELYNVVLSCAEGGRGRVEKVLRFPQDGRECFYNVVVVPVRNAGDSGYILLMTNITGLKELDRQKNDFIATISHELKTPLAAIVMGASMLEDDRTGPLNGGQREIVSAISEYAGLLTDLVGEMLELTRAEAGRSVYHLEPCRVEPIVEASRALFEKAARRKRIGFSVQAKESLPPVYGDPAKLGWVLNNLLSNAFKYTAEGGSVRIETRAEGAFASVSVADNGEGIPPEFLGRVFDKFVQAPVPDVEARGSGLGLYAARSIITAHGGLITAESGLGQGSRFTFTIPFYMEEME